MDWLELLNVLDLKHITHPRPEEWFPYLVQTQPRQKVRDAPDSSRARRQMDASPPPPTNQQKKIFF